MDGARTRSPPESIISVLHSRGWQRACADPASQTCVRGPVGDEATTDAVCRVRAEKRGIVQSQGRLACQNNNMTRFIGVYPEQLESGVVEHTDRCTCVEDMVMHGAVLQILFTPLTERL